MNWLETLFSDSLIDVLDHNPDSFNMSTGQTNEPDKDIEWKSIGKSSNQGGEEVVKKRLPKKIRQIPDSYFLPRRSLPSAVAFYGAWIVAGVGAGMLAEIWINKKIKEDGGVIWEFNK